MNAETIFVSDIRGHVHVAIITIRQDEYNAMESYVKNSIPVEGGHNSYQYASILDKKGKHVNIVLTRVVEQGNIMAQSVANNIIADIDPAWLFLVGIAGGVPDADFGLGDVIIASSLKDFSLTAATEEESKTYQTGGGVMHQDVLRFLQTGIGGKNGKVLCNLAGFEKEALFRSHPPIKPRGIKESEAFYGPDAFRKDVRIKVSGRFPNGKRVGGPIILSGPCANGNVLVKDTQLLRTWQQSSRQIVNVETELAGVYQAARSSGRENYPLLAIRGLSDIVGLKRNHIWTSYACQTAAAMAYSVLSSGFIKFDRNLPREVTAGASVKRLRKNRRQVKVDYSRLPLTNGEFLNRDEEFKLLDEAWADASHTQIVVLVAQGGVGKTSLVRRWLIDRLQTRSLRGVDGVFAWSFYKLGTHNNPQGSEDGFFNSALRFFGVPTTKQKGTSLEKGMQLAEVLRKKRSLLILDGIESLQNPLQAASGKLRTQGLSSLLNQLATTGHRGLCIITTQEPIKDLSEYIREPGHPLGTVISHDLDYLSKIDGARLLHRLGVTRAGESTIDETDDELLQASDEIQGHALTIRLLGNYLRQAFRGDIRKRNLVKFEEADLNDGGYTFKILAAYEKWLSRGEERKRSLAVLRLLSLFNGPAEVECLAVLRRKPALKGLTEPLIDITEREWNVTISRLCESGLIFSSSPTSRHTDSFLNCHALLRDYFSGALLKKSPNSYHAAHWRIYEHLSSTSLPSRPDLDDLIPLYKAIIHACSAGHPQQAYDDIYVEKINRSVSGDDSYYAVRMLGAYNADFVAVNCFFKMPWKEFLPGVREQTKIELLIQASKLLHGLGRVAETRGPLEHAQSILLRQKRKNSKMIAEVAMRLTTTEWRLGNITKALHAAKDALALSEKSGDYENIIGSRLQYAYALHMSGKHSKAMAMLGKTDALRTKASLRDEWMYNFRIFEILLTEAERMAWLKTIGCTVGKEQVNLAKKSIELAKQRIAPIIRSTRGTALGVRDYSFFNLIRGRIALYAAQCCEGNESHKEMSQACKHLEKAVKSLSSVGLEGIPFAMSSLAWLRKLDGDESGALANLNKVWQIASRGAMTMHMAGTLLNRVRLFFRSKPYPWGTPADDLLKARRIIERCGYWRRKKEIEDAEKVIIERAAVD